MKHNQDNLYLGHLCPHCQNPIYLKGQRTFCKKCQLYVKPTGLLYKKLNTIKTSTPC